MAIKTKHWDYIDALKSTVIVMIVLNHSIQYGWTLIKIATNDFQNPIMFFASGLIFSFCIDNIGKYNSFKVLLQKKQKDY